MPVGVYKRTKPVSAETRAKMSASRKGHEVSEETRQKLSVAHKGKSYHNKHGFSKGHGVFKGSEKGWFKKGHTASTHPRPSGEKHYNWKGGVTSKNDKIRKSRVYVEWRKKIMERDNYTCQLCGKRGGRISVDHIKPFSLFPELRFDDSNARVLCWGCHVKTPTFAGRVRNYA